MTHRTLQNRMEQSIQTSGPSLPFCPIVLSGLCVWCFSSRRKPCKTSGPPTHQHRTGGWWQRCPRRTKWHGVSVFPAPRWVYCAILLWTFRFVHTSAPQSLFKPLGRPLVTCLSVNDCIYYIKLPCGTCKVWMVYRVYTLCMVYTVHVACAGAYEIYNVRNVYAVRVSCWGPYWLRGLVLAQVLVHPVLLTGATCFGHLRSASCINVPWGFRQGSSFKICSSSSCSSSGEGDFFRRILDGFTEIRTADATLLTCLTSHGLCVPQPWFIQKKYFYTFAIYLMVIWRFWCHGLMSDAFGEGYSSGSKRSRIPVGGWHQTWHPSVKHIVITQTITIPVANTQTQTATAQCLHFPRKHPRGVMSRCE